MIRDISAAFEGTAPKLKIVVIVLAPN